MTKLNGHSDPNVTSLDDARRRAAEKAKSAPRAAGAHGPRTARDWLIGGVTIAIALGFVAWMLLKATNAISGGAA